MKRLIYILILGLIFITAIISCKKDDEDVALDPQSEQLSNLMNNGVSWTLGTSGKVLKDDFDVTSSFEGFKLIVGDFTYQTENSLPSAWSESGTWQFHENNVNEIIRDDGVLITLTVSDNNLIMTFMVSRTSDDGRLEGVEGIYEFHLESE